MIEEQEIGEFNMKTNFTKLSAQNKQNPSFEINPQILEEYNKRIGKSDVKNKKSAHIRSKVKFIIKNSGADCDDDDDDDNGGEVSLDKITNLEKLESAIQSIFKKLKTDEYHIKETHQYTQILPVKYYGPGSHSLNRQVAFALKNTDERLFLSWIMLRSKAEDFEYETIPKLYQDWKKYFHTKTDGVTRRSIIYWAKTDAFEEYNNVRKNSIDYYLEETINTATDYDFAVVLYQMNRDSYVCASIQSNMWYGFKNHRWEIDKGNTLRLSISITVTLLSSPAMKAKHGSL